MPASAALPASAAGRHRIRIGKPAVWSRLVRRRDQFADVEIETPSKVKQHPVARRAQTEFDAADPRAGEIRLSEGLKRESRRATSGADRGSEFADRGSRRRGPPDAPGAATSCHSAGQ